MARRAFIAVGIALVAVYAGATLYLAVRQRALIYIPSPTLNTTPASAGLAYEDVRVPVGADGAVTLHGWWLPAPDSAAPVFLYLHGNDLNIASDLERFARLNTMGFGVLAIDYRGYGKSGGEFPSERRLYEDVEAAWQFLVAQRSVAPSRIYIYGHSLGGAIATELALHHPDAAGLVVESTFTTMAAMAKIDYWMFPVDFVLDQRFDTMAKVPHLRLPVLFVHGVADVEVPSAMSEQLFAAAAQPKALALIPGAGHDDSGAVGGELYTKAVRQFIASATKPR